MSCCVQLDCCGGASGGIVVEEVWLSCELDAGVTNSADGIEVVEWISCE